MNAFPTYSFLRISFSQATKNFPDSLFTLLFLNATIICLFSVLSRCHSTNIAVFWLSPTFPAAIRVAVTALSVSSVPTPSSDTVSCFSTILSPVETFLTFPWCSKYVYLLIRAQLLAQAVVLYFRMSVHSICELV